MSYSTEAANFFARLATQPTAARGLIYDRLISGLVACGVWAKLDVFYLFAAFDAPTALTNLISSSFNATALSSPTFSADNGYTGGNVASPGPTARIDTGFDPSSGSPNFVQNSASIFVWKNTNPNSDLGGLAGIDTNAGGGPTYIYAPKSDGKFYYSITASAANVASVASNVGLFEVTRSDGSTGKGYISGIPLTAVSGASSAPVSGKTLTFLLGDGDGTNAQISAGGAGSSLTDADSRNLATYIKRYLNDVASISLVPQLLLSSNIVNDAANNYTPGICRLADGRLLVAYCIGSSGQLDGKIVYHTSSNNGLTWSSSSNIVAAVALNTYTDVSVKVISNGTIIASAMTQLNNGSTITPVVFIGTVAGNLSISWSSAIIVKAGIQTATTSYVLQLANGNLILGLYNVVTHNVSISFSTDLGLTWGGEIVVATVSGSRIPTESNFVQLANGDIVGIIRVDDTGTASNIGYWRTISTDNGATWSALTQVIDNTISSAPSRPAISLSPLGKIFLLGRFIGPKNASQTGWTYSIDGGVTWNAVNIYYNLLSFSYGEHVYSQCFYDTSTDTIMSVIALGSFSAAEIVFQQFYLESDAGDINIERFPRGYARGLR